MENNNYSEEYYAVNKQKIRLKQKIYYQKHKEKLKNSALKYYGMNRGAILTKNKTSDRKKLYDKKYYAKHKDRIQHRKKMEYIKRKRKLINK